MGTFWCLYYISYCFFKQSNYVHIMNGRYTLFSVHIFKFGLVTLLFTEISQLNFNSYNL